MGKGVGCTEWVRSGCFFFQRLQVVDEDVFECISKNQQ